MKILGVETSTMLGGVALMDSEQGLIAELRLNVKSTHSEKLMPAIAHVLRQAYLDIADINAFAVAIGPGSFTGLRVGLNTVKGLAFATGKPIVPVPTLEAFAWNFPYSAYPVCPMLDARRKEVYAAVFRWNGHAFERLITETSIEPVELVKAFDSPVILTGDGALLYREAIITAAGRNAIFAEPLYMIPSPANVASLGLKKALAETFSEPMSLTPFYIRKSEAEAKMSSLLPLAAGNINQASAG